MREFLVEITTAVPEGTSQEEVDRRRAAEAVRAGELAGAGRLARLWRPVGELRGIGVWRAVVGPDRRQVRVADSMRMRLPTARGRPLSRIRGTVAAGRATLAGPCGVEHSCVRF
ncbi:muconolactone Delta-isomerase family protein [Streptomyces sp. NPDC004284]|uniref:muconolactone Delta-isomerase family protein n=1 Tax=Streptomyces sp. NPDC004284 TaxID=3364695 RepID=UPI00368BF335